MSWLSETLHGHFDNPLAYGLAGAAALALPFVAGPALGALGGFAAEGLGALGLGATEAGLAGGFGAAELAGGIGAAELGAEGLALAGGELGFDALAAGAGSALEGGGSALGFAAEGGLETAMGLGEAIPSSFLEAGAGTPGSFYEAVGLGAGGGGTPAEAALGYLEMGPPLSGMGPAPIASSTAMGAVGPLGPEMASGMPFASTLEGAAANTGGGGLWSSVTGALGKNPLGTGVAGAGLLYNIMSGQKNSDAMNAMAGQAGQLSEQGKILMSYLQQGKLPPGLQQGVTNATNAMRARIIANHAKNGMSTNPSENSALAQELNNVDMQAMALIAQEGEKLMTLGLNSTQISSNLYATLEKLNREQSASIGRSIATFASALGGGGTTIRLG